MDHNLQQLISPELRPGEGVVYSARAVPSHGLNAFGIWLFAIPWTVFSVAWEIGVTAMFWSSGTKPGELFQDGRRREIQSVPLNLIAETIRREDRKGAGDLVSGLNTRRDSDGDKVTEERKVEGVLNVKAFEEAVLSAKRRMGGE